MQKIEMTLGSTKKEGTRGIFRERRDRSCAALPGSCGLQREVEASGKAMQCLVPAFACV